MIDENPLMEGFQRGYAKPDQLTWTCNLVQESSKDDLDIRRPGNGIQPIDFDAIIGKRAKIDITKEQVLQWEYLE